MNIKGRSLKYWFLTMRWLMARKVFSTQRTRMHADICDMMAESRNREERIWKLLGNGAVNTFPQQIITCNNKVTTVIGVLSVFHAEAIYHRLS
jgi:hypothetical protein